VPTVCNRSAKRNKTVSGCGCSGSAAAVEFCGSASDLPTPNLIATETLLDHPITEFCHKHERRLSWTVLVVGSLCTGAVLAGDKGIANEGEHRKNPMASVAVHR
jgi:hypothetical protein